MRNKSVSHILLGLFAAMFLMTTNASGALLNYGENQLGFINYENVFNLDGTQKTAADFLDPNSLKVGDVFVGIMNINYIYDNDGTQTFWPNATNTVLGVFAQQVKAITTTAGGQARLTLGASSVTNFTALDGTTINTGLTGDEIFALYTHDAPMESNGTLGQDFSVAQAGDLWMTLGYSDGGDNTFGTADDDGYMYSKVSPLGTPAANFSGEAFAGLNVIQSSETWIWTGINNDDENEISGIGGLIPGLMTDWYMHSTLKTNEYWDPAGTGSPWMFQSDDPAHTNVVPEPGTFLLFGFALLGFSAITRKKIA